MKAAKTIADILHEHSFFQDLSSTDISFIAGCGKNVHFDEGQIIAKPADPADEFYLIREGRGELFFETPPRKALIYQTLGPNEILGLSWLIPPYIWPVSAKAQTPMRAIAIDAACLRAKCENDPRLGYMLMKHLAQVLVRREEAICLQLLDVYGDHR